MTEITHPSITTEQLLNWWHCHQTEWLSHEADTIRNGLLQDLFAVRRRLELLNGDCSACLVEVEQLYQALEHLGNRLSSPFIHDSLPLAIQYSLAPWQERLPLAVQLPTQWPPEPTTQIRLLLSVLEYWLTTLGHLSHWPQSLIVKLTESTEGKQLSLRTEFDRAVPLTLLEICESDDWLYRLHTFQIVAQGITRCQREASSLEWQLCW